MHRSKSQILYSDSSLLKYFLCSKDSFSLRSCRQTQCSKLYLQPADSIPMCGPGSLKRHQHMKCIELFVLTSNWTCVVVSQYTDLWSQATGPARKPNKRSSPQQHTPVQFLPVFTTTDQNVLILQTSPQFVSSHSHSINDNFEILKLIHLWQRLKILEEALHLLSS